MKTYLKIENIKFDLDNDKEYESIYNWIKGYETVKLVQNVYEHFEKQLVMKICKLGIDKELVIKKCVKSTMFEDTDVIFSVTSKRRELSHKEDICEISFSINYNHPVLKRFS